MLFVISSPSGGGKTTLSKMLLSAFPDLLRFSVSLTTREPRDGEKDGYDYNFVSYEEFEKYISSGSLIEYASVFGNYYGTLESTVEDTLNSGRSLVLDIDWQGAQQIMKKKSKDSVSVFILPPSVKTLEGRLKKRMGDIPNDTIDTRLSHAKDEMLKTCDGTCYDYVLINDDLDKCFESLKGIFLAEHNKRARYVDLRQLVQSVLEGK